VPRKANRSSSPAANSLDGLPTCGPWCALDLTVFMDTIDEELPASFLLQDWEREA